jgi:hypothetical protein
VTRQEKGKNHMPQYKVVTFGGMDGVKFPDLLVKFSTGYLLPLHVKQGEYIPLEILDPLDVKKSLLVGSLGRYIACGDVIVEDDSIPASLSAKTEEIPNVPSVKLSETPTPISEPMKVQPKQVENSAPEEQQLTNLSQVKQADDFFKLGYFLKLRFIKECNDKTLLQQLHNKTDSKQLQNNIQIKLAQL